MTQIEQLISKIEEKKYNYKAMLKSAEPNSENFYCYRSRVALCEELLEAAKTILKESASEDLEQAATNFKMRTPFQYPNELHPAYEGFKAGTQWQKEQMMKDAIDSEVKWCNHGYPDIPMEDLAVLDEVQLPKNKFVIGDKVKVIIIKE